MSWPTKKLVEVCELIRGTEPGSESYFNENGKGRVGFIRIGDLTGKIDNPKFVDKKLTDLTIVNPDEILISFDGTPGVVVKGIDGAISSGTRVIRNIKQEVFKDFLFYYLQTPSAQDVIKFYTTGVTILHASRAIPHIKVPVPPLKIQHQIVERLDVIKKAQELNDKQIALAEELFQSLLNKELNPKGKNWDFVELGKFVQKIDYGLSVSVQDRLNENGVPILTMAEIENDGQIDYQKARKISVDKNELKTFKINKGELLFNWRNEKALIGKTGLFNSEKDFVFASFLLRIITNEKALPEFLWYWLNYLRTKNSYLRHAHLAGNQASYNANSLRNKISCPLVSIETQLKIVEKLSAVQEYKKKLLAQKQLLQELFASALNKSFKGQL